MVSEGCFSSSLNACAINAPKKSSLSSLVLLALVMQSETCNRSGFPLPVSQERLGFSLFKGKFSASALCQKPINVNRGTAGSPSHAAMGQKHLVRVGQRRMWVTWGCRKNEKRGRGCGSTWYGRSLQGEERDGSSFTRRCLSWERAALCRSALGWEGAIQVVGWKTLPPLITHFAEQSPSSEQGKSMKQSQAAHAVGAPAWDPLPHHAVPKGDPLVPPEVGGLSCRSSSSVGAVPKKVAWDSGDTRDTLVFGWPKSYC